MRLVTVARWSISLLCAVLLAQAPLEASADWAHLGNPICVAPGAQHDPICILPWIAWTDERDGVPQAYALQLNWRTGVMSDALRVAPSTTAQNDITAIVHTWDGSLWTAWSEDRGLGTGVDLYIQRTTISGLPAPGWPADGLRIVSASGDQRHPRLLEGFRIVDPFHPIPLVFVSWEDARNGAPALYATAVDSGSSTIVGWSPGGTPVSAGTDPVANVGLVRRGYGAVAVSEQSGSIYAQALSLGGTVPADPSFPLGGRQLSESGVPASHAAVAHDDDENTLVAWEELRDGHTQIRAQGWRDSTSYLLAPAAIPVLDDTLARPADPQVFASDYQTMAVVWRDERADAGDLYESFVQLPGFFSCCLFASGSVPFAAGPGRQSDLTVPSLSGNGTRGFWQDARSGVPQIHAYFWPDYAGGPMAATGASQTQPSASFTIGGYIPEDPPLPVVVWTDMRNPATGPDIYAQVLGVVPGLTPVPPPGFPARIALSNARPTPARGATRFALDLPAATRTEFVVTDVAGRLVRSLGRYDRPAGRHMIEWDARTDNGVRAAPGLYWLRGTIGDRTIARRIVLLGD